MSPILTCVSPFEAGNVSYKVGETIHADEADAARLLRRSPTSFEVTEGEVRIGGPSEVVDYGTVEVAEKPVRGQQPLDPDHPERLPGSPAAQAAEQAQTDAEQAQAAADAEAAQQAAADQVEAEARTAAEGTAAAQDAASEGDGVDLEAMNLTQLRAFAKERGLKVRTAGVKIADVREAIGAALDDAEDD